MTRNRSLEVHAGWGAAVALAVIVFGFSPLIGFVAASVAGVVVEVIHYFFPTIGTAAISDVLYTIFGGAIGALIGIIAMSVI